jgi:acyl carrier protein
MNNSITYNIIYKTLTKELGIKKELIHNRAIFCNDLGLNDTEFSILLFYIENHFNIDIPQDELNIYSCVNDLMLSVKRLKTFGKKMLTE